MRIFGIGISLLVLVIVLHNYFGGFTSRNSNKESAEHFAESAQSSVNESVSEYEKKLQKSLEQAGAD